MPRKLDSTIAAVLKRYDFGSDACWDCHGVWVVYHRALEQIAAKAGIVYGTPTVLVAEREAAAILVMGTLGDRTEWSIGEATIGMNYKVTGKQAAYPFAMAEKRAKDRVILKLIGLTGLAYSEEEADDFKAPMGETNGNKATKDADWTGPLPKTALKAEMAALLKRLGKCANQDEVDALKDEYAAVIEQCQKDSPGDWAGDGGDIKGYEAEIELAIKRALDHDAQQAKEYFGAIILAKTQEEANEVLTGSGYDEWLADFRTRRKDDAEKVSIKVNQLLNAKQSVTEAA